MNNNTCDTLPLAAGLMLLYRLANGQYGNQEQWYAQFFGAYHNARSEELGIEYTTSQATISRVLHGVIPLPRRMYAYYTSQQGDASLRCDIDRYLDKAIGSARQRAIYISQLEALARNGSLDPQDRDYILGYDLECDEDDQLTELVYRMLRVLIREPLTRAA